MKASVTATEMLKFVTWVRSSLQAMNSRMWGWSTRRMTVLAPRRVPPCCATPAHAASIRLGDGARDSPEQVLGPLGRLPLVVLHQVAALEHGDGVGAQIECAGATGSSHAGSSLAEVSLLTKRVVCVNLLRADQKGAEGQGRPMRAPGQHLERAPPHGTSNNSHHKLVPAIGNVPARCRFASAT